ncbi:hypothetical protein GOP47_0012584 [Adiantum capillus-veneris]|uniref:Uncharacterized protein n=1 Tax=Adiantum capillus-veneris TaxID=13818 RepID=A0A9D4UQZ2_ADICA|nr:hypothetical protein GOP47_0012584 [Adiantum capillus-veneris]
MVDWGRALVLCCSVSQGCAALFSRLLHRSEVALEHVVPCCSVDSGRAALFGRRLRRSMADLGCRSVVLLLFLVMSCCIAVLFVGLWWIGPFCSVPCCSMHRGFATLLGRLLRRPVMDLGRRSVLLLLFPVLSCCIVVFSVGLWWIGAFCCVNFGGVRNH